MQSYIPPFLLDIMAQAMADPTLQVFCGAILAAAIVFFWKTRRDYARLRWRLGELQAGLEKVLGAKDLPQAHFEQQNLKQMMQETDVLEHPFASAGLTAQWQRLRNNMTFFIDTGHGSVPEEVLQSTFSPASLERSHITNGTGGRSAFLTSLGVLGTFAGLVFGVSAASQGLASPDISVARHALSTLLAGAELAFLTSILGLSLSLLHSIWLNRQKRSVARQAGQLLDYLSKAFAAKSGMVGVQWATNRAAYKVGETAEALEELARGLSGVEARLKQIDERAASHDVLLKSIGEEVAATRAAMQSIAPANLSEIVASVGADLRAIHGHTHHLSASVHKLKPHAGEPA